MSKKYLVKMADDLGIELAAIRRSRSKKAEEGFWKAVDTMFDTIKWANTRADRERFHGAIKKRAEAILS